MVNSDAIVTAIAGKNLDKTAPEEGRIGLKAASDGFLRVHVPTRTAINSLGEITAADLQGLCNMCAKAGLWLAPVLYRCILMIQNVHLRSSYQKTRP